MLEIPESQTIAKQLNDTIQWKIISDAEAAQSPHGFAWYYGDPKAYGERLSGRRIDKAVAVGGQVEIYAEDMRLLLADGANIRYLSERQQPPKKHQLYLEFDDETGLVCTVQMYGLLYVYPAGTLDNQYYNVAVEKPNPLTDAFDEAYFGNIVSAAGEKLSAKGLLATEQRIPGLGNGVLQDILFRARIHPQSKVSALTNGELHTLYKSVKETLKMMTDGGGRDTERDILGNSGGYKTLLSSKTYKSLCPGCGGMITRKAYMGGNVYFCDFCQPLKK